MKTVVVNENRDLVDVEIACPTPRPHDVLVQIKAISINPIDIKRIHRITPDDSRVLGYDALGEVVATGSDAHQYQIGDVIFYAGGTNRNGSYADYQLVDERLTALAPTKTTVAEAAAMPLTWLTAYEILVDKLGYHPAQGANRNDTILVINGAGGAGSVLTQFAKWLGLTVIATASPRNFDWLRTHGTAVCIDYHGDIQAQLNDAGYQSVDAVVNFFDTAGYFDIAREIVRPFGHLVNVALTPEPIDIISLQAKSLSFDWELTFTKSSLGYDMASQGQALALLSRLLDNGDIKTTLTKRVVAPINAITIGQTHALLKANAVVGKIVVEVPN